MSVSPTPRRARYLIVGLRWLSTLIVVFASTLFAGNYITDHVLAKVYTATAELELPAADLVIPAAGATPEPVPLQPEFENSMTSPDFLLSVIKDLGLERRWSGEVYDSDEEQLADVDALTRMEKLLRLEVVPGKNIVKITASSDDAQEAAEIANAVADRYKTRRDNNETHIVEGSPVRILARAQVPEEPTRPNKHFDFIVTILAACFLSVCIASFVEIVFMFIRAAERIDN